MSETWNSKDTSNILSLKLVPSVPSSRVTPDVSTVWSGMRKESKYVLERPEKESGRLGKEGSSLRYF